MIMIVHRQAPSEWMIFDPSRWSFLGQNTLFSFIHKISFQFLSLSGRLLLRQDCWARQEREAHWELARSFSFRSCALCFDTSTSIINETSSLPRPLHCISAERESVCACLLFTIVLTRAIAFVQAWAAWKIVWKSAWIMPFALPCQIISNKCYKLVNSNVRSFTFTYILCFPHSLRQRAACMCLGCQVYHIQILTMNFPR